ncbi:MAG TPA: hypothetical protein PK926_13855 [Spirochaetota bacterium]|nr:hypothetical protein [Spirochaetota bacterium]HPI88659.1 hypothetical protein [Spirochaetota bacterium]HPR49100.1 hypothetical protein [Spirochaetota bacterium]
MTSISVAFKNSPEEQNLIRKAGNTEEIPLQRYYVLTYRGFRFHTVDIKHTPKNELEPILKGCEAVEKVCWKAQEDFFDYARKRDLLTYVEKEGKIVAFQIASYWIMDNYFIFDLDETMVLKECRGNSIARALAMLNGRTFYLRMCRMKGLNKMVFMGLTPNMRLVNTLDRLHFVYSFMDNSFNPSPDLLKIHDTFLEKKGAELVHKDYPFFLKSAFPGSLKPSDCGQKISKRIEKILPPGLDFNYRGDAFLFFMAFGKLKVWPAMIFMLLLTFGVQTFINVKLGIFSRKKFIETDKYLKLNGNTLVERRKNDRRNPHNTAVLSRDFVERRKSERRVSAEK